MASARERLQRQPAGRGNEFQRFDEILRAWLQARFDVPALERTTRGIMYLLRVRRETDDWRKEYLQLLHTSRWKSVRDVPSPRCARVTAD